MSSLQASKRFVSVDSIASVLSDMPPPHPTPSSTSTSSSSGCKNISVPPSKRYAIWLSFYELYNDNVYDLLVLPASASAAAAAARRTAGSTMAPGCVGDGRASLKIRQDARGIPYVEGLVHVPVSSTREAIKVLKFGEKNLQKSNNSINAASSRSHAVFCLKIVSFEANRGATTLSSSTACINQLSFCDLAGIERLSKTHAVGKTMKESSNINTSLLALSRCINTMISNQRCVKASSQMQVPYRGNKLTRLFQAYFEGRSMVKMIVNLNPSVTCFDESVNVLKFASIANQIQIGLNDDDKVHYKISEPPTLAAQANSRLTVAWAAKEDQEEEEEAGDGEHSRMDEGGQEDGQEESDEDEDEDENEESGEEEEDDDDEMSEESANISDGDDDDDEQDDEDDEDDDEEDEENDATMEATATALEPTINAIDEDDEDDDDEEDEDEDEEDDDDEEEEDEDEDDDEEEEDEEECDADETSLQVSHASGGHVSLAKTPANRSLKNNNCTITKSSSSNSSIKKNKTINNTITLTKSAKKKVKSAPLAEAELTTRDQTTCNGQEEDDDDDAESGSGEDDDDDDEEEEEGEESGEEDEDEEDSESDEEEDESEEESCDETTRNGASKLGSVG